MFKGMLIAVMLVLASTGQVMAEISKTDFKEIKKIVKQIQIENDYVHDWDQYGSGLPEYAVDIRATGKGDCEDYALAYLNAIIERFPQHKGELKLMHVLSYDWRTKTEGLHAVLFINYRGRTYVADTPGYRGTYPYSKEDKFLVSVKDLRATQYTEKRILGELRYVSPTQSITFNALKKGYEKGW